MDGSDLTIGLQVALENVSHELGILARKALAIDEAMGDAISGEDALEALPLELTQDVDLMRQSADCLHILLDNLATITGASPQPPAQVSVSAVTRGVYLSAIRERVTATPKVNAAPPQDLGEWIDL